MRNFFITFLMLVTIPVFATGVSSTETAADCNESTLDTYTGTSNLSADWQANTIALHWYSDDTELTVPAESQSCTYDGTLTPPSTIPTKTGYTFKGWRVRGGLPAGYTRLEYIESTGTQYIDTGIQVNNNFGIHIDFQYTNTSTAEQILFGHVDPNFIFDRSNNRFVCAYKLGTGVNYEFFVEDIEELISRHTLDLNFKNDNKLKFDDMVEQLPQISFTTSRNFDLFAGRYDSYDAYMRASARIFSAQITNYSDFVCDFVPAKRNSDDVVGMWDRVSETFFTNAGTGDFVAGPAIQ